MWNVEGLIEPINDGENDGETKNEPINDGENDGVNKIEPINEPIKQILDIITLFLLVDDNPTRYNLYMSAGVGDKRQTIITIEEL